MPNHNRDTDKELLLRFLDDELSPEETRRVRKRLDHEPRLAAQLKRLQALRHTLEASAVRSFEPGFARRVTHQITLRTTADAAPSTLETLYEPLVAIFARLAVAAVLLIGVLGAANAAQYQEAGMAPSSVVEAVFGLPDVTLETALDEAVIYVDEQEE